MNTHQKRSFLQIENTGFYSKVEVIIFVRVSLIISKKSKSTLHQPSSYTDLIDSIIHSFHTTRLSSLYLSVQLIPFPCNFGLSESSCRSSCSAMVQSIDDEKNADIFTCTGNIFFPDLPRLALYLSYH